MISTITGQVLCLKRCGEGESGGKWVGMIVCVCVCMSVSRLIIYTMFWVCFSSLHSSLYHLEMLYWSRMTQLWELRFVQSCSVLSSKWLWVTSTSWPFAWLAEFCACGSKVEWTRLPTMACCMHVRMSQHCMDWSGSVVYALLQGASSIWFDFIKHCMGIWWNRHKTNCWKHTDLLYVMYLTASHTTTYSKK